MEDASQNKTLEVVEAAPDENQVIEKKKKPRSKAQMAAFEKARQKRLENLKLKREAKQAEKEHKMIKKLEREKKKKVKKKQLKIAKKKIMKYKAKKHKYVSESSDSDEPEDEQDKRHQVPWSLCYAQLPVAGQARYPLRL